MQTRDIQPGASTGRWGDNVTKVDTFDTYRAVKYVFSATQLKGVSCVSFVWVLSKDISNYGI